MMKRLIAALTLCFMLASTAWADKYVLVIRTPPTFRGGSWNNGDLPWEEMREGVIGALGVYAVKFKEIPNGAATNTICKTGVYGSDSLLAVVHMGFSPGVWSSGGAYFPDNLTLAANWPAVPQIFIGMSATIAGCWTNTSTCSTGVGNNPGNGGARNNTSVEWLCSNPSLKWSMAPLASLNAAIRSSSPGIWRPLVGMGYSMRDQSINACDACDDLVGPGGTAPDTVVMWERCRSSAETAPLIFVWPNPSGSNGCDFALFPMALAVADSASHWRIIGSDTYGRKLPANFGLAVGHAFGRGAPVATGNSTNFGGVNQDDTTKTSSTIKDSLNSLGVPIWVGVNTDSVKTYLMDKRWWDGVGQAKFGIQDWSGVSAVNNRAGPCSGYFVNDAWGLVRTRAMLDPGKTLSSALAAPDSSLYSNLRWSFTRVDSIFGSSRTSRAVWPPNSDWIVAQTMTRTKRSITSGSTDGLGQDSIALIAWKAGVNTILLDANNPDNVDNSPNMSIRYGSGGTFASGIGDNMGSPIDQPGYIPVYSTPGDRTTKVGQIKLLLARAINNETISSVLTNHSCVGEFWWGFYANRWYMDELNYYQHNFRQRTTVLAMDCVALGGDSANNRCSPGWWQMKAAVNQAKATNILAGRTVLTIRKLEDVDP